MTTTNDIELNQEQLKALNLPAKGVTLVRGIAGSGKTTIAVLRSIRISREIASDNALFADDERFSAPKISLFSYNKTLVHYLNESILEAGGNTENFTVQTMHQYAYTYLKTVMPNFKVLKEKDFPLILANLVIREQLTPGLANRSDSFILDEFKWIKGMMFNSAEELISAPRRGREGRLSREDKTALWITYVVFRTWQEKNQVLMFEDFPLYAIKAIDSNPNFEPPYDAIIIDEAQDLSKAGLSFLSRLAKNELNSIMVLADAAQSIYQSGFSWKEAGLCVRGSRSIELKQNFRNSVGIFKAAGCVIESVKDKSEFSPRELGPNSIIKDEGLPMVFFTDSMDKQNHAIVRLVKKLTTTTTGSIVILCRTHSECENMVQCLWINQLKAEKIQKNKPYSKEIQTHICTMHSAKGLEFDYVIIPNLNNSIFPAEADDSPEAKAACDNNRRLLYTCMTRAKRNLYLFSSEYDYSPLLNEIHEDCAKFYDLRNPESTP